MTFQEKEWNEHEINLKNGILAKKLRIFMVFC